MRDLSARPKKLRLIKETLRRLDPGSSHDPRPPTTSTLTCTSTTDP